MKLRPQVCLAGDFAIRIGDVAREMYIVHKGRLRVITPDLEATVKDLPLDDETVRSVLGCRQLPHAEPLFLTWLHVLCVACAAHAED